MFNIKRLIVAIGLIVPTLIMIIVVLFFFDKLSITIIKTASHLFKNIYKFKPATTIDIFILEGAIVLLSFVILIGLAFINFILSDFADNVILKIRSNKIIGKVSIILLDIIPLVLILFALFPLIYFLVSIHNIDLTQTLVLDLVFLVISIKGMVMVAVIDITVLFFIVIKIRKYSNR